MSINYPYSKYELDIIKAIYEIDKDARFHIRSKINSRHDYLYGAIVWDTDPIGWDQVTEIMYKHKGELYENKNA